MKSDFLRELGVTEQSVIDAIMAENGRDITKAQKDYEAIAAKVEGLEAQLTERDGQLSELKKSVKDNEKLSNKITELEQANETAKTEYENKIAGLIKEHELESKLRDAKAKNIKAVKALLNADEDFDKQINALKAGEDTSFLFEQETQTPLPSGTSPRSGNQPPQPKIELTFADRVREALSKNQLKG